MVDGYVEEVRDQCVGCLLERGPFDVPKPLFAQPDPAVGRGDSLSRGGWQCGSDVMTVVVALARSGRGFARRLS